MVFKEKKVDDGVEYEVEDVFGLINFHSTDRVKIEPKILDTIVLTIRRVDLEKGSIRRQDDTDIEFTFKKAMEWEDDVLVDNI